MTEIAADSAESQGSRLLRLDIFKMLRQDILSCRIAPGVELREAELAERFNVSKSPVRDALSRLVQEGLVIVMPRQGYRVAPVSVKDVRDMFEYRAILEGACARLGAEAADDEALRALDRFRSYNVTAHPEGFAAYNREFHRAVAGLCGNARLIQSLAGLIDQMDRVVTMSVNGMRGHDPVRLVLQHGDIIDALQRRDGRRAAALMTRHVLQARKRVCAALTRLAITE